MGDFFWIRDLGLMIFIVATTYFAFRYFGLERALRDTTQELTEIQGNVLQNRILHLPLPDKGLEALTKSINRTLEQIRREHLTYEKREREFQQQIENISHDLRTPLTVILGYLKWLKSPAGSTSFQLAESLEILERNARSMEHLVSQFYAFSRLNAMDFALELERLDLCRLLRESLADNYQSQESPGFSREFPGFSGFSLERPGFSLKIHLPEHSVMAQGNREACERIFANMLQNAGRYAHSYLDIGMSEHCGQVQVFFENDSTEITENDIPNLFHRFYRNSVSRSKGSSGLGLAIAKSLAEAMGGSLTAQALPGTEPLALRFVFTLAAAAPSGFCPKAQDSP